MAEVIFRINLHVDQEGSSEEVQKRVDEAMGTLCYNLDKEVKTDYIGYNITGKEVL